MAISFISTFASTEGYYIIKQDNDGVEMFDEPEIEPILLKPTIKPYESTFMYVLFRFEMCP